MPLTLTRSPREVFDSIELFWRREGTKHLGSQALALLQRPHTRVFARFS